MSLRIIIMAGGVDLLVVTAIALFGIGAYANFLQSVEGADKPLADFYRNSVRILANCCIIGLIVTAGVLIAFAAVRIFSPMHFGPEQALDRGRQIIKDKVAGPSDTVIFESFISEADGYTAKFKLSSSNVAWVVKLRKSGAKFDIVPP